MQSTNNDILECGHKPSPHDEHTTGYATDNDGKRLCYDCAAETDRRYMREHGIIGGYVSSDLRRITTWVDRTLLVVTKHYEINKPFGWGKHDGYTSNHYYSVRAVDPQTGETYYGRGHGKGIYITMRRTKGGK